MKFILTVLLALPTFAVIYLLLLPVSFLSGWVLRQLWEWFIIPVFHLPALTAWQGVGIGIVLTLLTHQTLDCETPKRNFQESTAHYTVVLMKPLFLLFAGWVVTKMMA